MFEQCVGETHLGHELAANASRPVVHERGGADIKGESAAAKVACAASNSSMGLKDGDLSAANSEAGSGGHSGQPGTYHGNGCVA
jgi:hypothetical protein